MPKDDMSSYPKAALRHIRKWLGMSTTSAKPATPPKKKTPPKSKQRGKVTRLGDQKEIEKMIAEADSTLAAQSAAAKKKAEEAKKRAKDK